MPKKIKALKADLLKYLDRIQDSVDERVASAVGFTVRTRMLQMIATGISPILGYGRFPEYKAATRTKVAKRGVKFLNSEIRKTRSRLKLGQVTSSKSGVGRLRAQQDRLRILKKIAQAKQNQGYPYNTKEYRQGKKRPRPVNLWLTGDFLRALTFELKKLAGKAGIEIGWWEPKQAIKEKGHREGANGQPKRPTLPRGSERWNQTIQLDIMKLLRDAVSKAAKTAKRG